MAHVGIAEVSGPTKTGELLHSVHCTFAGAWIAALTSWRLKYTGFTCIWGNVPLLRVTSQTVVNPVTDNHSRKTENVPEDWRLKKYECHRSGITSKRWYTVPCRICGRRQTQDSREAQPAWSHRTHHSLDLPRPMSQVEEMEPVEVDTLNTSEDTSYSCIYRQFGRFVRGKIGW